MTFVSVALASKLLQPAVMAMILMLLAGMRIAAIMGDSCAVQAK